MGHTKDHPSQRPGGGFRMAPPPVPALSQKPSSTSEHRGAEKTDVSTTDIEVDTHKKGVMTTPNEEHSSLNRIISTPTRMTIPPQVEAHPEELITMKLKRYSIGGGQPEEISLLNNDEPSSNCGSQETKGSGHRSTHPHQSVQHSSQGNKQKGELSKSSECGSSLDSENFEQLNYPLQQALLENPASGRKLDTLIQHQQHTLSLHSSQENNTPNPTWHNDNVLQSSRAVQNMILHADARNVQLEDPIPRIDNMPVSGWQHLSIVLTHVAAEKATLENTVQSLNQIIQAQQSEINTLKYEKDCAATIKISNIHAEKQLEASRKLCEELLQEIQMPKEEAKGNKESIDSLKNQLKGALTSSKNDAETIVALRSTVEKLQDSVVSLELALAEQEEELNNKEYSSKMLLRGQGILLQEIVMLKGKNTEYEETIVGYTEEIAQLHADLAVLTEIHDKAQNQLESLGKASNGLAEDDGTTAHSTTAHSTTAHSTTAHSVATSSFLSAAVNGSNSVVLAGTSPVTSNRKRGSNDAHDNRTLLSPVQSNPKRPRLESPTTTAIKPEIPKNEVIEAGGDPNSAAAGPRRKRAPRQK